MLNKTLVSGMGANCIRKLFSNGFSFVESSGWRVTGLTDAEPQVILGLVEDAGGEEVAGSGLGANVFGNSPRRELRSIAKKMNRSRTSAARLQVARLNFRRVGAAGGARGAEEMGLIMTLCSSESFVKSSAVRRGGSSLKSDFGAEWSDAGIEGGGSFGRAASGFSNPI